MIGAQALLQTLVGAGVDVCFMNPGTSEMHFVHELDAVPQMRAVLTLFEGVATGAADGYARMTGRPAAVLLHLGPGLGNGLANLHNARRAHTPLVCIVGAHAIAHEHFDAPLQSDIAGVARTVSGWLRTSAHPQDVGRDAAAAVAAACTMPGQIATLVLPADVSWGEGAQPARPRTLPEPQPVDAAVVTAIADVLALGEPTLLLLGGAGAREPALRAASWVAAASGAQVLCEVFPARQERGAGVPRVGRLPYLAEVASKRLKDFKHIVLAGARSPVSFFAYPGQPGDLIPEGCQVHTLAAENDDVIATLQALADRVAQSVHNERDGIGKGHFTQLCALLVRDGDASPRRKQGAQLGVPGRKCWNMIQVEQSFDEITMPLGIGCCKVSRASLPSSLPIYRSGMSRSMPKAVP